MAIPFLLSRMTPNWGFFSQSSSINCPIGMCMGRVQLRARGARARVDSSRCSLRETDSRQRLSILGLLRVTVLVGRALIY